MLRRASGKRGGRRGRRGRCRGPRGGREMRGAHGAGRVSLPGDSRDSALGTSAQAEPLFVWGARTYVMGIVNVTPDSFSGDGVPDADEAVARGVFLAENGADILDVGGESTRPGAKPVEPGEELRRVIPVIEALRKRARPPISVDTYRASTAEAALDAGAAVVNDVWG